MNWLRVKNRRIIEAYANIHEGLKNLPFSPFSLIVFMRHMEDLLDWTKKNHPTENPEDAVKRLGSEEIVAAMYETPIWDDFLKEIVEPVNEKLPEVVPIRWEDY